jgi:transposase
MERLVMRQIKEVLRLKLECKLSNSKVAIGCNISRETVRKYLIRAADANLSWPLPVGMDDDQLEALLFPCDGKYQNKDDRPDLKWVHSELKSPGVTLSLLWDEYKANNPNGIGYSRFCVLYKAFVNTLDPVMRQIHKAGEKLFVDYAGTTIAWTDKATGEIKQAELFVATLGASNHTFVEATHTQSLEDWIGSHCRAFVFFGGVTKIIVPDNLKSGVTKAHIYDPKINLTYQDMADHYKVAIIPARVSTPKDKAKVETSVRGITQSITAKLRHHNFFSVADINKAIAPLLTAYNNKGFQKLPGSRSSTFTEIDQPALQELPEHEYEYASWRTVRVNIDYHVHHNKYYYSVPYTYIKKEINIRITSNIIQCFYRSKLIATHVRDRNQRYSTIKEHMPKNHQEYAEWTPERIFKWASKSGAQTAEFIKNLLEAKPLPQQSFRACLGVMRLGKQYGDDKLEKACARASALNSFSYKSVASILKHGLEDKPLPEISVASTAPREHSNVRGSNYYT